MPSESDTRGSASASEDSLLPDLLHALSQPLTALRCSLELTLLQPRNSEEYRKRLRESLGFTVEITTLTAGIRELLEIEQAAYPSTRVALDKVLRTSVREFLPVADHKGVEVSLLCGPSLFVLGDPEQFSKATFCLMDFFLGLSCKGDELTIQAIAHTEKVETEFLLSRKSGASSDDVSRKRNAKSYLAFLIGRRVFELSGGHVQLQQDAERTSLRACLPMAPVPDDLEMEPAVYRGTDG
jgi:hypothetical protein